MDFKLRVLGTASAMPISGKFQSAQVLNVHGRFFLIDCGDGIQMQMVHYRVPMMKIDSVFISHIHGDHVFGIFGFLSTLGMKGRTAPLNVYAPSNFGPILKFFLSYYGEGLSYEIRFNPISPQMPEVIYYTKSVEVLAFPLNHKINTFGYMFREKRPQYNVIKEAISKYGLTIEEIGVLKRGEDVRRNSGTVIRLAEAAYLPYCPRSYAYVSDTAPFEELAGWIHGVSLLYHETTYLKELSDQAAARHHSTTVDAASCALKAGVGRLIIGHYSSRCKDILAYEKECREIFPETYALTEGDEYEILLKMDNSHQ